jgi:structural maintenance of chromosome 4
LDEAKESLKSLKEGGQGKQEQYAELKKEAAKVKKALAEKEQEFEVS